jgi:hypothetical protein
MQSGDSARPLPGPGFGENGVSDDCPDAWFAARCYTGRMLASDDAEYFDPVGRVLAGGELKLVPGHERWPFRNLTFRVTLTGDRMVCRPDCVVHAALPRVRKTGFSDPSWNGLSLWLPDVRMSGAHRETHRTGHMRPLWRRADELVSGRSTVRWPIRFETVSRLPVLARSSSVVFHRRPVLIAHGAR